MTQLPDELRETSKQVTDTDIRALMQSAARELETVEAEADKLAHEAAREAARAEKAEEPTIPPDFLNMP